jgi:N-acetylglucosaminyldiphosphoundecaprenol N-acetyl-beta-D-mannosaminyltransferase
MIEQANILGIGVSAINIPMAVDEIDRWISENRREYVCVTGMHGVMESQRAEEIRRVHNAAGLVTPDGMPLVWLLRWFGHRHADRVYGPDLLSAVFERARVRGYRHFLYGSTPETLHRLEARLTACFRGAEIAGRISPPFRALTSAEDGAIVATINQSGADIVWVGLSTPRQELWMAEHRARLAASVLIGVGAAFDYHAGMVSQAPRFIQRSGFEWLFRLLVEPRRLWRRYLTNIPPFLIKVAMQLLHLRRYSLEQDASLYAVVRGEAGPRLT